MNQDKQTDGGEDREFREWCIAAAQSAEGSASITARNAWNARAALANIAVGAYLGKMTLRDRDVAMDASLESLQTTAYADGRADERTEVRAEVLRELLEWEAHYMQLARGGDRSGHSDARADAAREIHDHLRSSWEVRGKQQAG